MRAHMSVLNARKLQILLVMYRACHVSFFHSDNFHSRRTFYAQIHLLLRLSASETVKLQFNGIDNVLAPKSSGHDK